MDLIDLYRLADQYGVSIDNFPMRDSVAISFPQGWIAIDFRRLQNSMETKECIAHEMGHIETGSFYNNHSPLDIKQRHEYRADKWAVHRLIPFEDFRRAIKDGNIETWQLAEYFDVTEDFIRRTEYVYQCEGRLFEG